MDQALAAIPLIDHHCHALRRPGAPLDGVAFRRHFSESLDPAMADHLPFSLFYRRSLRVLAAFLGCAPDEESVVAARNSEPFADYARRLLQAAGIATLLIDTGYRGDESFTLDEHRALLPCRVQEVLRLETLIERLVLETDRFAALEAAFRAELAEVRARGIVALKSIAAYRGGLQIMPRTRAEAVVAYPALKERARRDGRVRLVDRPLLEYLLRVGLEIAAAQELPVQFHTGFGDPDVDLRSANPLHLRPLLEDPALRGVAFVLLHTYPYPREAGYLASVYPNTYIDLSLTLPFTAHSGVAAILAALELAPTSKLLLATDAFSIPELYYVGAYFLRESLDKALEQLCADGWLEAQEIEPAAWQMLHENAKVVYRLE